MNCIFGQEPEEEPEEGRSSRGKKRADGLGKDSELVAGRMAEACSGSESDIVTGGAMDNHCR